MSDIAEVRNVRIVPRPWGPMARIDLLGDEPKTLYMELTQMSRLHDLIVHALQDYDAATAWKIPEDRP